jgi:hypothetical protein
VFKTSPLATQKEAIALLRTDKEKSDYESRLELFEAHTPIRE